MQEMLIPFFLTGRKFSVWKATTLSLFKKSMVRRRLPCFFFCHLKFVSSFECWGLLSCLSWKLVIKTYRQLKVRYLFEEFPWGSEQFQPYATMKSQTKLTLLLLFLIFREHFHRQLQVGQNPWRKLRFHRNCKRYLS